jgi:predicted aspartyl protease
MIKSLLLGIAALAFLALPARADDACTLGRVTTLDMGSHPGGGVEVPIEIGGRSIDLLVDTGGVYSMLTEATVASLGLRKQEFTSGIYFKMFGGKRIDRFVEAHDVLFGGLKAERLNFLVMPDEMMPSNLGGTLAPDVLRAYDVDFDFGARKFSLFSQDHCEGKVVYWTKDYAVIPFEIDESGHISLPVMLDGKELRVGLDTGASRSTMTLEWAESLFGFDETTPGVTRVGRQMPHLIYPFKTMTFGGVTVTNPDIELVSEDNAHMRVAILGLGVLRKLHLYIAYKERKLYVSPADAH